jgi:hypothetical protein
VRSFAPDFIGSSVQLFICSIVLILNRKAREVRRKEAQRPFFALLGVLSVLRGFITRFPAKYISRKGAEVRGFGPMLRSEASDAEHTQTMLKECLWMF